MAQSARSVIPPLIEENGLKGDDGHLGENGHRVEAMVYRCVFCQQEWLYGFKFFAERFSKDVSDINMEWNPAMDSWWKELLLWLQKTIYNGAAASTVSGLSRLTYPIAAYGVPLAVAFAFPTYGVMSSVASILGTLSFSRWKEEPRWLDQPTGFIESVDQEIPAEPDRRVEPLDGRATEELNRIFDRLYAENRRAEYKFVSPLAEF